MAKFLENQEDEDQQGCDEGIGISQTWTSYEKGKRVAIDNNKKPI